MGRKPLADNPYPDATPTWGCDGGNAFLDIAIVDAFQTSTGTAMETTLGNTQVSALPGDRCKAWPAFIQIQADLQDFELKAATAHEYMHALLYGYNVKANCMSPEYSWINEATAQWAIEAVFHDGIQNYEQRPTGCFLNHPDLSIEHDPGLGGFSYGAYLFPFFLSIEYGSPSIKKIWQATELYSDSLKAVDVALQDVGGWKKVWPEFARKNWNKELVADYKRKDGLEIGAVTRDTELLNDCKPVRPKVKTIALGPQGHYQMEMDSQVAHLAAHYYDLKLEPGSSVRSVLIDAVDFMKQEPTATLEALVKIENEIWKKISFKDKDYVAYCLDVKSEQLEELVLVLSNSEWKDRDHFLSYPLAPRVSASNIGCWRWRGTIKATTPALGYEYSPSLTDTNEVEVKFQRTDKTDPYEHFFDTTGGKWRWQRSGIDSDGCTHQSGPYEFPIATGDGTLRLRTHWLGLTAEVLPEEYSRQFSLSVHGPSGLTGVDTITCPPGGFKGSRTEPVIWRGLRWHHIYTNEFGTDKVPASGKIEGSVLFHPYHLGPPITSQWRFEADKE
jgi:hypothetical protein